MNVVTLIQGFFKKKPNKYLMLKFADGFELIRKARVLEETQTTYFIATRVCIFNIRFDNYKMYIAKDDPRIVEVFER